MTTILPTDKNLRAAIAWIEERRKDRNDLVALLGEAGMRFNLTPREGLALARFYDQAGANGDSGQ